MNERNDSRRASASSSAMSDEREAGVTRRRFLAAGGAVAAAAVLPARRARAAQTINVTCWGGSYEKGIREHFADPFTKETGIEVVLINNADLTKMKVQVESR